MKDLKTTSFSISINAGREKIWSVLWNPKTYGLWTNVFAEGSHFEGDMKQGNTIKFLAKDGGGMTSYVEKLIENEQMVFAHQKELKNGVESDSSWQGAKEIYHLKKEDDNRTELQIIMDTTPDMEAYFNKVFPKALSLIKQLSEQ